MRLTILGGGGFRVPLVFQALSEPEAPVRVDELVLLDSDPRRLAIIEAVLAAQATPLSPAVSVTTDIDRALTGADFVFCAIRVGGLAGRVADERVALRLGVLGQETTGPGGLAFALRTIPVMRRLAERTAELAPNAYFINFTNPAGIVTEALTPILGDRVIGICDTPIALVGRVSEALAVPIERVDYLGLNHLGWLRAAYSGGTDVLPRLLADDVALARVEETEFFGPEWIRAIGAIPNEYLYYYYFAREAVAGVETAELTRGEFLERQQNAFFDGALTDAAARWHRTIAEREATYMAEAKRGEEDSSEQGHSPTDADETDEAEVGGGGYHRIAVQLMAALAVGTQAMAIVNVRNRHRDGTPVIAGLPPDCVVEVPCTVDAAGAVPAPLAPPTGTMLGLLQSVKAVEQLTIAAATQGSATLAWQAFAAHPLVDSVDVARDLLTGYQAAHPELAYLH